VQPHRNRAFYGHLFFSGSMFNTRHAAPHRFQIETFHPVYWTAGKECPGKHSGQPKSAPALDI
jgi:hypothetical protein